MSQPPASRRASTTPPTWRRPRGVDEGVWAYVNERSIADRYDQFVADTPLCELDALILHELFPSADDATLLLDLGCGSGRNAIPISQRGYLVVGIDLSPSMLQVMMAKPNHQVQPLRCNLVELDCLSENVADHAICMFSTLGMIKGSEQRLRFLRELSRIVRPRGRFVVHVHNRWMSLYETRGIRNLCNSWVRSKWSEDTEFGDTVYSYRGLSNMFLHRFSRREFSSLLSRAGWSVERLLRLSKDSSIVDESARIPGGFIAVCRNG